jgi:hypothetical protein
MKKLYNQNYQFKPTKCPSEITLEMLIEEMKSPDTNLKSFGKEYLWTCYYNVMFPPNVYGLTADLSDLTDKETPLFIFEKVNEEPKLSENFISEEGI